MLEHGGRIGEAAARWGIPAADWLDLSTGIAPFPYPVPPVPPACWQRLPEDEDGLDAAAQACYGAASLLPLPGSQAAIMGLPRLRGAGTAAVLTPAYGEYAAAWRAAGHRVAAIAVDGLEAAAATADVVMLGNPNNPDGLRFPRDRLLAAAGTLARRGGWLVVDEAFADAEPEQSLAAIAGGGEAPNLVVLRSLGKFYGLAGARVGFAIAAPALLERLRELVGPWAVANPARWAARHALADAPWQAMQREHLNEAAHRLARLLENAGFGTSAGTALFRYLPTDRAMEIFEALARQGILVRRFAEPAALRFGLPGDEAGWRRLEAALRAVAG
ncbi:MAG: threonine-phosphate decarboxylase CobD [Sterolibacteriaceae bacterium MAG5]|nr:threonine-phosphate decarboxylase CobD [Candidatus Nitricoxidireducens bremensis]